MEPAPDDRFAVTIVVPTMRRPRPLKRALESLFSQRTGPGTDVEIVVVDNAPEGDARSLVLESAASAPFPVRYAHEPRPGVARARNRGVAEASGDRIAFLDDDEEAAPGWLDAFVAAARATAADALFGPVSARAEDGGAIEPFQRYFGRTVSLPTGVDVTSRHAYLGTNNSFFNRARCLSQTPVFDDTLNETGGEDSVLLSRLAQSGAVFAWASEAKVAEFIPRKRLTWSYVTRRKFLSGQIRIFAYRLQSSPQWGGVALWMAIGAMQTVAAGAMSLAVAPFDRQRARHLRATMSGGLGKVFWTKSFHMRLYGDHLVS